MSQAQDYFWIMKLASHSDISVLVEVMRISAESMASWPLCLVHQLRTETPSPVGREVLKRMSHFAVTAMGNAVVTTVQLTRGKGADTLVVL